MNNNIFIKYSFRTFYISHHSAGKRDRDLTPSPYNARWPEGPRAPLSERSEL